MDVGSVYLGPIIASRVPRWPAMTGDGETDHGVPADRQRLNDLGQPIGLPVQGWTPRPAADPAVLEGRYVRLEALKGDHAEVLHPALNDPAHRSLWTYVPFDGPFPDVEQTREWATSLHAGFGWAALCIRTTDTELAPAQRDLAAGVACYLRPEPAMGTIEVGGIVLGPALQRTRAATEAMYLMARHVFSELGYRRYEWKCDALNAPSRAAALRLGFTYEGTWRNALIYKGRNRDTAWFSITDDEWRDVLSPAFEAWLDPANFDGARQRASLSDFISRSRS